MSPWQTRSTRTVYENPWIRVREDEVVHPDGSDGIYGVIDVRHSSVFVVAVTDDDEVVLVRMARYTMDVETIEVPAGGTDGEDPLLAARRELREEAGLEADSWEELGEVWSLNGVARAPGRMFLARGLRPAPKEHEAAHDMAAEGISEVLTVSWPELWTMIGRGEITDGESLAPLLRAAVALGKLGCLTIRPRGAATPRAARRQRVRRGRASDPAGG